MPMKEVEADGRHGRLSGRSESGDESATGSDADREIFDKMGNEIRMLRRKCGYGKKLEQGGSDDSR